MNLKIISVFLAGSNGYMKGFGDYVLINVLMELFCIMTALYAILSPEVGSELASLFRESEEMW